MSWGRWASPGPQARHPPPLSVPSPCPGASATSGASVHGRRGQGPGLGGPCGVRGTFVLGGCISESQVCGGGGVPWGREGQGLGRPVGTVPASAQGPLATPSSAGHRPPAAVGRRAAERPAHAPRGHEPAPDGLHTRVPGGQCRVDHVPVGAPPAGLGAQGGGWAERSAERQGPLPGMSRGSHRRPCGQSFLSLVETGCEGGGGHGGSCPGKSVIRTRVRREPAETLST